MRTNPQKNAGEAVYLAVIIVILMFAAPVCSAQVAPGMKLTTGTWIIEGLGGHYGIVEHAFVSEVAGKLEDYDSQVWIGHWQFSLPLRTRSLLGIILPVVSCLVFIIALAIAKRRRYAKNEKSA